MTSRGFALVHGDALRVPLADGSVDLAITSPPYFALRSYTDDGEHYAGQIGDESTVIGFLAALWAVSDELWRVLKPTGSAWVNLGDKYAGSGGHNNADIGGQGRGPASYNKAADVPAKSLMGLPWRYALGMICPALYRPYGGYQWTLRAEVVWSKPNGLPESVTDRVRRSHEQWFHFVKQGRYYAATDEIRERHARTWAGGNNGGRGGWDRGDHLNAGLGDAAPHPLGALPGSVWTIPSEPLVVPDHLGVDHYAAFPQEWPRRLILGWSPPGICASCGQGRRPIVERQRNRAGTEDRTHGDTQAASTITGGPYGNRGETDTTITGYGCDCPDTSAPTRPAVVLDPFVGTGTVPMVARALGRFGVGVDLSRDYLRLARWRVIRSRHGAKSEARTNRERQGALW